MSYKAVIPIVSGIAYVSNPIPELVKGSRTPYREYTSDFQDLAPRSRDDAFAREIQNLTGVYDFQIRIFRALGSGKHWVGVSFWDNEEFEDYKQRNLVVTLQSGKSWGVAENKVLRWLRGSDKKRGHYDETGAGSIGFLRRVLEHVKWTISGARSVSPVAGRPLKPVRLKVGWGNDKRERAYAWLTRLGFTKVPDAGDGDPAYILDIGEVMSNPADLAYVRNGGKTYADLLEELRWLGPGSVMKLVFNGNTRQCGESAFTVAQYLIERGFTARTDAGAGKYCSHFDLAVHTADQGWVSVDPTYIQFQAPNNESHALDIADRKLDLADDVHRLPVEQQAALVARFFEPTVQWSVAGMLDGTKAFEIAPAPHVLKHASPSEAETPGQFRVGKTWRQHWEWYRGMAEDLTRGDFDEIDTYGSRGRSKTYWLSELSKRLMGKTLSGSKMKTNPIDLAGRHIPERYLAGLPPALQQQRIRELTQSRDAYKRGDYSELPTDRAARKMGLVKQSKYTTEAKKRGIEYRGDLHDMASRVLRYYGARATSSEVSAFAEALRASFAKGLAAWKSGGHRPGATAQNWAVARVNSLVVGGKTSWTADKKQFEVLPAAVRQRIESMRTMKKNGGAELYHTTRSGPNGETVQSFARGVDPNRAQGFGQGAGFFLWRTKAKALEHARGLLAGDFMKEEQVTGEPIIVVIDEPVRPETFDIDYEDMGPAFLRVLEKHKDWIRAHKAELSASINDDGLGIRIWGHGQMSRSLKFDSDTLMASHGASLGRLGRTIATLYPEVMEQFEREMFTTARALKYVGPAGILPKRIETIDGTVIWSRARSNPIHVKVEGTPPQDLVGRHARFFTSRKALDRIEEQGAPVVPNIEFVVIWEGESRGNMKGEPGVITLITSPLFIQGEADRMEKAFGKSPDGIPRRAKVSLFTAHTVLHRLGDVIMPDEKSMGMRFGAPLVRGVHRDLVVTDGVDRAWRNLARVIFAAQDHVQIEKWLPTVVDTKACREGWINDFGQAMAELVPYRLLYKKGRENGVKLMSDLPFVPQLERALTEYIDETMKMLVGYRVRI